MWKETMNGNIPCTAPLLGASTVAVHINVAEIPDHVRDDLAAATLDFVRGILRQPGGRAALDAKIKALAENGSCEAPTTQAAGSPTPKNV